MTNVCVIGVGAMGGGMARALHESNISPFSVTVYDRAANLVADFYSETKAQKPDQDTLQAALENASIVVLVLQNEPQCEQVCFGNGTSDPCLLDMLEPESCVVLCSTVTAVWVKRAAERFQREKNIYFVDAPISGGPVRARAGDLTIMASGDSQSLEKAKHVLAAMARNNEPTIINSVDGTSAVGLGSTVKMVHQLLAGVHIVAAAEALTLASKAGLDVQQVYDIVMGAAGASWMFGDRATRMIKASPDTSSETQSDSSIPVKSQTQIFVKDLDIVYNEAKRLQSPIPLASTALQQFISAVGLGLAQQDDSQVVQVYEKLAGTSVTAASSAGNSKSNATASSSSAANTLKEGTKVGDYWKLDDGTLEQILEVADEPRHNVVLSNEYIRALRVSFPPNDTTLAHRHAKDSLYFFLVDGGLDVVNHVQGQDPACDCMEFGEVRFGQHESEVPLVHKITNKSSHVMLCIDAEVLKSPSITSAIPLVAERHECIKTRDKVRVYKLVLEPGESVKVCYPFFHLSVTLYYSTIEKRIGSKLSWTEQLYRGDIAWNQPVMDLEKKNVGDSTYVEYIAEWR